MTRFRLLVAGVLLLLAAASPAGAQNRVALVIGNSNYRNVSKLPNPANDAAAVAQLLKSAAFTSVKLHQDLESSALRRVLRDFSDVARDAEIAVVFYAGHGIEVNGENYLIPVDAKLERDIDVEDEAVSLERVLTMIEPARRLRLVILDACRDNPFLRTMKRTLADRAIGRGLARVDPTTPDTLIAFAAKAGSTAADGEGPHSPFTTALLAHLAQPGLDVRLALGLVRDEVLAQTGRKQEPFVYGSLGGQAIALLAPKQPPVPAAPAATERANSDIRGDYELAEKIGTVEAYESFLTQYNFGFYANLARAARAKLLAAEAQRRTAESFGKSREDEVKPKAAEPPPPGAEAAAKPPDAPASPPAAPASKPAVAASPQVPGKHAANPLGASQSALVAPPQAEPATQAETANKPAEGDSRIVVLPAPEPAKPAEAAPENKIALAPAEPAKPEAPVRPAEDSKQLARRLQEQLQRVGCDPGHINGRWSADSRRALENFNKHAGTRLDLQSASLEALDVVKSKTSRVCPLICGAGWRARGDHCVQVERPSPKPAVHHAHREAPVRPRALASPPAPREPHSSSDSGSSKTCNFIHGAMLCF